MKNGETDSIRHDAILDHIRGIHEAMLSARAIVNGVPIEDRCWNWYGEFACVTGITLSEARRWQEKRGGTIKSDAQLAADYQARRAGKDSSNA